MQWEPVAVTSEPDELGSVDDADLLAMVRADGDDEALAELCRRHREVADRVARRTAPSAASDIVAEAFERVIAAIRKGGGPNVGFRSYLLATVNNVAKDTVRRESRLDHLEDEREEPGVFEDPAEDLAENAVVAAAFDSLPSQWQRALWLTEVEGRSNQEVAEILDLRPGAVASLTLRARRGLQEAYLGQHVEQAGGAECEPIVDLLPAYVRRRATPAQRHRVEQHLDGCAACRLVLAELEEMGQRLGVLLTPLLFTGGAVAVTKAGAGGAVPLATGGASLGGAGSLSGTSGVGLALAKGLAGAVAAVAIAATPGAVATSSVAADIAARSVSGVTDSAEPKSRRAVDPTIVVRPRERSGAVTPKVIESRAVVSGPAAADPVAPAARSSNASTRRAAAPPAAKTIARTPDAPTRPPEAPETGAPQPPPKKPETRPSPLPPQPPAPPQNDDPEHHHGHGHGHDHHGHGHGNGHHGNGHHAQDRDAQDREAD